MQITLIHVKCLIREDVLLQEDKANQTVIVIPIFQELSIDKWTRKKPKGPRC